MTSVADLDTPALLVDITRLERNIAAMQAAADRCAVALRPHTKTHKSPVIAGMQVAAGARGLAFAGLRGFGGQAYGACSADERRTLGRAEGERLAGIAAQLAALGLPPPVISTGSTPSMPFVAEVAGVTEARPGVYVFGDL